MQRGCYSLPFVVEEEKLRGRTHSCVVSLARCHARGCSHAFREGKNGPHLSFSATWREATPSSFEAHSWGTDPPGWRLFLSYFVLAAPLPKAVDWLPVPSQQQIACTLVNTVVFLPVALRYGTRTLFRFQGTPNIHYNRTL